MFIDFLTNTDVIIVLQRKIHTVSSHHKQVRHHGPIEQQFLENWLSSLDDKNQNNTSMSAEKYRQQLDLVKKARSED